MKRMILVMLLGMLMSGAMGQTYKHAVVTVTLKDTVYSFNDLMDDARDKSGRIMKFAFGLDDVWAGCSDATIEPGSVTWLDEAFQYPMFDAFIDDRIPYTVVAADTSLQPDGSYKNIQSWWIDRFPAYDPGVRMSQGSCPDTCEVIIYMFYGIR